MASGPVPMVAGLTAVFALLLAHAAAGGPPAYDEREALTFVQYGRAAFCTKESVLAWDCGEACDAAPVVAGSVRFFGPGEDWKVQGYVAQLPSPKGQCVVAFRGSIAWQNWLADAYAVHRAWPPEGSGREGAPWCSGCMVHAGFAKAYEELRPDIVASLKDLRCASTAVVGHSLGGALASLAMLDFRAQLGLRVWPAYSFGKPRVGNPAYAKAFVAAAVQQAAAPPSWRVVHYKDPVPRIPPGNSIQPYEHEPHEVYYDQRDSSSFRECEMGGELVNGHEDSTCAWSTSLLGCINFDHLEYLNKSFAHKTMQPKCTGVGSLVI